MVKYKPYLFLLLIFFFLLFSFYPTIFELWKANPPTDKLGDPSREFILEHNYYWPDFNLYLSKIRQGTEGHFTAIERYTSEIHSGSLIQEFYVILGLLGRLLGADPNTSYQLGRVILSPLLLILVACFSFAYFKNTRWQLLCFLIVVVSGSFPRFFTDSNGAIHIGRYMEWWSNIDSLQRITFIPHILFGQVVSFYLLYQFSIFHSPFSIKKFLFYIFLGNLAGLVFPPSLITLDGVIVFMLITKILSGRHSECNEVKSRNPCLPAGRFQPPDDGRSLHALTLGRDDIGTLKHWSIEAFIILTLPSLLYFFFLTKIPPWSALVDFHRTHPMMIPFWEYILGTGPVFFLGLAGSILVLIKKQIKFLPLVFWLLVTFFFAMLFTYFKEQSPLRFTQTGLFIPLGILGAYFFQQISLIRPIRLISPIVIILYLLTNLFIMKTSLDWQTTWISQRIGANVPAVPYPPQTMYPIRAWMDGIRFLRDKTERSDVVLAEITAGNYIPAYSGNSVYFGQSNTLDYERKQSEVTRFFEGKMGESEAVNFFHTGRIKYIFFSVQEKEKSGGKKLEEFYPTLKSVFTNPVVTIYSI